MTSLPDQQMIQSLRNVGLLSDVQSTTFSALDGGVSSDIWHVQSDGREFCVKRALSKLKVAADWYAPLERNQFEVAWYQLANDIVPGSAPAIIAHDDTAMLFAMEYLPPDNYRNWKSELLAGRADSLAAARAGNILGRIHAGAAGSDTIENRFPRDDIFHAIRLEPYLEATAAAHPDLAEQLYGLSNRTAATRLTMIHGDVSPKNILLGPEAPVFIDAECACYGDPAFDLAFCLNHFLLKCLATPRAQDDFLDCFNAMSASYLEQVNWESPVELQSRTASLLPGLFLARVDGKSPVEYLDSEADRERIRRCARAMILNPPTNIEGVSNAWRKELTSE